MLQSVASSRVRTRRRSDHRGVQSRRLGVRGSGGGLVSSARRPPCFERFEQVRRCVDGVSARNRFHIRNVRRMRARFFNKLSMSALRVASVSSPAAPDLYARSTAALSHAEKTRQVAKAKSQLLRCSNDRNPTDCLRWEQAVTRWRSRGFGQQFQLVVVPDGARTNAGRGCNPAYRQSG